PGLVGAGAYAVVPPRLSRLERKGALPEDLAARARGAGEDVFRALSGSTELLKAVYARLLRSYERSIAGGLRLLASGRSIDAEEARLVFGVCAILGDKAT